MGGQKNPAAKKKAIVAIAHTLLKIAYSVLRTGTPYQDLGADFYARRQQPAHRQAWLEKQLRSLHPGCTVTVSPLRPPGTRRTPATGPALLSGPPQPPPGESARSTPRASSSGHTPRSSPSAGIPQPPPPENTKQPSGTPGWAQGNWHVPSTGKPHEEPGPDYFDRRADPERETRRLIARLEALGHTVSLAA
jgi:hypothetical protein